MDKMALGSSRPHGLTQRSPDREETVQTKEVSHYPLLSQQQGTLLVFALKVPDPRHRRIVGHPEWCAYGSLPRPRQPWEMSGLTRRTASHPTPTMVLTWRHVCWAPLTGAPEAALHTPVSPDHPVCPKCPPGRHSWEPPTGHRVWADMNQPHTVGLCVQALPTPTMAAGGPHPAAPLVT